MSLREILREVRSEWCPNQISTESILDDGTLTRAYIAKMFRHIGCDDNLGNEDSNIWSLFSFNNFEGRNIEIKFIHTLKRQYTFSIDSWQIDLSNFLPSSKLNKRCVQQNNGLSAICYCLFPDMKLAYEDLKKKLIRVVKPETVRGGCFLRYGDLLHKRYSPPYNKRINEQELVMLNRFLVDFGDQTKQSEALDGYLHSHMGACKQAYKLAYLRLLDTIVDRLKEHVGVDNFPTAASTLACVIKAKVHKFQMDCKVAPQLSLALNHGIQRRFCNVQNVLIQQWRKPRE